MFPVRSKRVLRAACCEFSDQSYFPVFPVRSSFPRAFLTDPFFCPFPVRSLLNSPREFPVSYNVFSLRPFERLTWFVPLINSCFPLDIPVPFPVCSSLHFPGVSPCVPSYVSLYVPPVFQRVFNVTFVTSPALRWCRPRVSSTARGDRWGYCYDWS